MKNLFVKSLPLIWVLMAVLFSCEEKVEVTNQEVSVTEAQAWFEGYAKDAPATNKSSAGRTDSVLNSNDFQKEIFWGKARKINSKTLPSGLIMPVWYENNFRFGKQAIRELWVIKENGKLNTFLIEILATNEYFKANGKIDMSNFTGTFTIHDWKKGFVAGRYYENGKVKGLLTNYKVVPSTKKLNKLEGGRTDGCGDYHFVLVKSTETYAPYGMEATTVWDPCYTGDYSWIHDLDRRYDIYYDNGGNPLDDCTHRGNCAGGGGNTDGNYYEPNWFGEHEGYPLEWWTNESWLDENFNLDPYDQYKKLTKAEKELVKQYPNEALKIKKNRDIAEAQTRSRYGENGLNDKSDAFRHTYFQGLNTYSVGAKLTKLFSDAHESETRLLLSLEKEMDLFNNAKGIEYGSNCPCDIDLLEYYIIDGMAKGELRYLAPIDQNDPNFWGNNGFSDPETATHGITSNTLLTPTNQ